MQNLIPTILLFRFSFLPSSVRRADWRLPLSSPCFSLSAMRERRIVGYVLNPRPAWPFKPCAPMSVLRVRHILPRPAPSLPGTLRTVMAASSIRALGCLAGVVSFSRIIARVSFVSVPTVTRYVD